MFWVGTQIFKMIVEGGEKTGKDGGGGELDKAWQVIVGEYPCSSPIGLSGHLIKHVAGIKLHRSNADITFVVPALCSLVLWDDVSAGELLQFLALVLFLNHCNVEYECKKIGAGVDHLTPQARPTIQCNHG